MRIYLDKENSLVCSVFELFKSISNLSPSVEFTTDLPAENKLGILPLLVDGDKHISGVFGVLHVLCPLSGTVLGRNLLGAVGTADAETKAEIEQWATLALDAARDEEPSILVSKLSTRLLDRAFLVGDALSVADLCHFARAHDAVAAMGDAERLALAPAARWFDLVQHLAPALPPVEVKLNQSSMPAKSADKGADKKKKEKGGKTEPKKNGAEAAERPPPKGKAGDRPPPKEKKPKEKKAPAPAPAEDKHLLARVDMRVGKIVSVRVNPNADGLYVEEIDVGEDKPRQIVSGLVKFVSESEMLGALVVVLCNLKPSKLRGFESAGMVLAASNDDHSAVELVMPPAGAKPGEKVVFEGFGQAEPDAPFLAPKKKYFDALKPSLTTNDVLQAVYRNEAEGKEVVFGTSAGPCTVKSMKGGHIG